MESISALYENGMAQLIKKDADEAVKIKKPSMLLR
jgi:hypothetical protein